MILTDELGVSTTPVDANNSWISIPYSGTIASISCVCGSGYTTSATFSLSAIKIDGKFLKDSSIPGAADEASSSVTGPSLTAAGTVSSFDAAATPPTLTVSTSDGRWLVTEADYQEDLKLNKIAQSKDFVEVDDAELFCIFDAEGNISDVSGTDPGYRDMVSAGTTFESFDLKFPALFSNGKTPDQTLPSGATLCVDVKATNISNVDYKLDTCITPEDPDPEPTAVMHGLRFDPDRETLMDRTNSNAGNGKTWTFSSWVKPTASSKSKGLIGVVDAATQDRISLMNTGEVTIIWAQGTAFVKTSGTAPDNVWSNLVISVDTTNADAANRIKVYINGIEQVFGSGTPPAQDFAFQFNGTNLKTL